MFTESYYQCITNPFIHPSSMHHLYIIHPSIQSIHLSIHPNIHQQSIHPYIHLSIQSIYPYIHQSIHTSIYLSIYLSIFLSIYLSIFMSIYMFIYSLHVIHSSIYLFLRYISSQYKDMITQVILIYKSTYTYITYICLSVCQCMYI